MRRLPFLLALLLVAGSALAEESPVFRLGDADVVKGDLSIQLYLNGEEEADPGIVLVEAVNELDYHWTDLPDVEADETDTYSLTWSYAGSGYTYTWPSRTRTALSVLSYTVSSSPIQLAQGATLPGVGLTVRGLSEDPDGATVVFSLWRTQNSVRVLNNVAASLVSSAEAADGTWTAVLEYEWASAAQTAALSGDHYGRFRLTLPSAAVVWVPPPPGQLGVRIHALP